MTHKNGITPKEFHDYLISKDLFRIKITSTSTGIEAILPSGDKPNISDFTQIKKTEYGWLVRLSFNDVHNEKITNGFFNK